MQCLDDQDNNNMLALNAYYLWNHYFLFEDIFHQIDLTEHNINRYVMIHIEKCMSDDYFSYYMKKLYNLEIPELFLTFIKKHDEEYRELKNNFQLFIDNKDIDPDKSLLNLDLVNAMLLEFCGKYKKGTSIQFGSINSLEECCPITVRVFSKVHSMRNERTSAHHQTCEHRVRRRISQSEYITFLGTINLGKAYKEIFDYIAEKIIWY